MPTPVLARGERIVIRRFDREHVDKWVSWPRHSDPLFEGYNPPQLTARQRDLYHQQYQSSSTSIQYSVEDHSSEFVGRISLREIEWRRGTAVLGVTFHPARLNQGFGSDALRTFLAYYFGPLKMNTLFLDVAAFNRRAFRVYEKCGFRAVGQRWGEPQVDTAGVFRHPKYDSIRHLFLWEHGLIRPLVVDMVLRRSEWEHRGAIPQRESAAAHA
jgi:diamine N-acetyltransferase